MSDWYTDDDVDRLVFDAIAVGRGQVVDLPDVFERIDSGERYVPSHDELDASLRRLSEIGRIRQVDVDGFVDTRGSRSGTPYVGLSPGAYRTAVRAYHADFAATAATVMRLPIMQAMAPPELDMDVMAIRYGVESVIAVSGGRISRPSVRDGTVRLPVRGLDEDVDRRALVEHVRSTLAHLGFAQRRVILRFADGRDEAVAGA